MFRLVIVICLSLIFLYGYALINDLWFFEGMDATEKGVFGDSWGAFTSIFSALGFCGILWTLKLQIDSTRKIEMDASKREESEKLRDFENSFFNMLTILQTIIKDMRVGGDEKKINKEGRSVFTYYYARFKKMYISKYPVDDVDYLDATEFSLGREKKMLSDSFEFYFRGRSGNFSHYYRYLYNTFKFIDDATVSDAVKKRYANILRAQISNYELLILLYNGNSRHGFKFSYFFEEYSVFDNLPVDKLISNAHVLFFNEKAWGDNADAVSVYKTAREKGFDLNKK
ncbi:putative phage abortive infection protein [Enterobacter sp. CC120223-11]|uniref:putative phage abortive infection protein n=1 Tax=Enterobacter sp. CC120223-11 TaxID=1378073 RepID=UPI000BD81A48|nr:putative phage abortive infection protein [Enterobacter sp. CC120223-11]SNY59852.1 Putative phage abortive infection protein [Enterobacter sp. CC120223-11]